MRFEAPSSFTPDNKEHTAEPKAEDSLPEVLERIRDEASSPPQLQDVPTPPPLPLSEVSEDKIRTSERAAYNVYEQPYKDSKQPDPEVWKETRPDSETERLSVPPETMVKESLSAKAKSHFMSASAEAKTILGSVLSGVYENHIKNRVDLVSEKFSLKVNNRLLEGVEQKKAKQQEHINKANNTYEQLTAKLREFKAEHGETPNSAESQAKFDKLTSKIERAKNNLRTVQEKLADIETQENIYRTKRTNLAERLKATYESKMQPVQAEVDAAKAALDQHDDQAKTMRIRHEGMRAEQSAKQAEYNRIKSGLTKAGQWQFQIARNPRLRELEADLRKLGMRIHADEVNMRQERRELKKNYDRLEFRTLPYELKMAEYERFTSAETSPTPEQPTTVGTYLEAWNQQIDVLAKKHVTLVPLGKINPKQFLSAARFFTPGSKISKDDFRSLLEQHLSKHEPAANFAELWQSFEKALSHDKSQS